MTREYHGYRTARVADLQTILNEISEKNHIEQLLGKRDSMVEEIAVGQTEGVK